MIGIVVIIVNLSNYHKFALELQSYICQHPDYSKISEFIYNNEYCLHMCKMISRKFNVDNQDLHSELVLFIFENESFRKVLTGENAFNGRVFTFQIMQLAKKLQSKFSSDEINIDQIVDKVIDVEESAIEAKHQRSQGTQLGILKTHKLKELSDYRQKLLLGDFTINELVEIIGLNTAELMVKAGITNRYSLITSPELYREKLVSLFDTYCELHSRWYFSKDAYLKQLIIQYGSFKSLYRFLTPRYSYMSFMNKFSSPSIWDIEELLLLVRKQQRYA